MLPRCDDITLGAYLNSASQAIRRQLDKGLSGDSEARLGEAAIVIARVAQQLADRTCDAAQSGEQEAAALHAGELAFAKALDAPDPDKAASMERTLDADALQSYLRAHPLGGAEVTLAEARIIPGGRCKLTALVSQSGARALPASFILRQDWQGGATDTTVAHEFALLEQISAAGIRAPRPLLIEAASSAVGQPFILLERMAGRQTGSLFTPPRSRALGLALADQLGRLHGLSIDRFAGVVSGSTRTADQWRTDIPAFRAMQARIGLSCRIIDEAIDWLEAHAGEAGDRLCLIHNDLGFHNFLTDGDTLTALLDWELAELGHPAADLGYVRPFIPLMLPWDEFHAAYRAAGGLDVTRQELRFHTVWNAVRLYGLIMQARAALAAGHVDDIEIAIACADNVMLLLDALAGELWPERRSA